MIESVDEFYSENLAQDVVRGMREAAPRGFFLGARPPFRSAASRFLTACSSARRGAHVRHGAGSRCTGPRAIDPSGVAAEKRIKSC